jgi:GNAT superfamily N-acetyltransferase
MTDDITIEVTAYSDAILDAYLGLLPEQSVGVQKGLVSWKMRDHPFGAGLFALARDATGKIVGINAFQPARFRLKGGARLLGHQSMDTIVHPSARGKGLFTRMIRAYYAHGEFDILYGFPNSSSAPGFFNKLGWDRLGTVPMLVKPLRTGFLARRLGWSGPDFKLPLLRSARGASTRLEIFDPSTDALWENFAERHGIEIALDRTADFLNWRYTRHPQNKYDIWARDDGSFVVCTMADKHGAKIVYLTEAIGEAATVTDIAREAMRHYQAQGAEIALAWSIEGNPIRRALTSAGFLPFADRLRPIEINAGARRRDADVHQHFADRSAWFLSYSDSDTV